MSAEEDLEQFEAEIELSLYQEYRAVLPMFKYAIETERRFYLANEVSLNQYGDESSGWVELLLEDAWVWDMYRPARFASSVRVLTTKDVNIEVIPDKDL